MDLKTKLLIIPCCKSKHGAAKQIERRSIAEFVSPESVTLLSVGRERAFQKPGTTLDGDSEACPAIFLYSGTMYEVEGFRDEIKCAIRSGMHVLVESGGYGLIRAEEPIHQYEAQMNRTAPVWRRILPEVLGDYVKRNHIDEIFVAGSKPYASVLKRPQWWTSATCNWFIA